MLGQYIWTWFRWCYCTVEAKNSARRFYGLLECRLENITRLENEVVGEEFLASRSAMAHSALHVERDVPGQAVLDAANAIFY